MSFDDKQIKRLKQLLNLLEPDVVTNKDFKDQASTLIEYVKKMESQLMETASNMVKAYERKTEELGGRHDLFVKEIKEIVKKETDNIKSLFSKLEEALNKRLAEIKDGKDADEDMIMDKVCKMIEIPKIEDLAKSLPVLGKDVRNALEVLTDDERLDISAIKGLEEKLESIKQETPKFGGGGFSAIAMERHFIDDETPAGTKDGNNTEFTLLKNPARNSLKLYKNGQRLRVTEDYTLSGKTITLSVAPASDEVLLADYRY